MQSDILQRTAVLAFLFVVGSLVAPDGIAAQQQGGTPEIDSPYRWLDGSFRVAPYAGRLDTGRGDLEIGPASTQILGARTRVRLAGPISLEGNLGYASSERSVIDPRLGGGPAAVDTVPFRWLVAEGALQFALTGQRTWHDLQPYVVIGAGMIMGVDEPQSTALADTAATNLRFELNTAPTAVAALGTEWRVSRTIGLGFEVRDHLWRLTTPDGFFRDDVLNNIEQSGSPAPEETQWTNNLEFGVSLWYYP